MRITLALVMVLANVTFALGESDKPDQARNTENATVDYTDASGRVIGSVTKIGGVTYFAGPDGVPLGVAETVNGERVFKRY